MTEPANPPVDLAAARRLLAAQPFSVLLGARLAEFGDGTAVLELPARDELRQQNGYLHGGVLSYAADNALTFAGGSVLGPSVLTGGLTISYLRPAAGDLLRTRATVVHASRRQAFCRCDLFVVQDGEAVLCAAAQGTIVSTR
ncbi:PaaI family thioesterase [Plantactinospora sp. GCM10030261]|uniref:PaaI family thioesterase n=1 Tax=Plantactinospora sp. GCM10030261 TaxID=3273420 RepID=UPI003607618F